MISDVSGDRRLTAGRVPQRRERSSRINSLNVDSRRQWAGVPVETESHGILEFYLYCPLSNAFTALRCTGKLTHAARLAGRFMVVGRPVLGTRTVFIASEIWQNN